MPACNSLTFSLKGWVMSKMYVCLDYKQVTYDLGSINLLQDHEDYGHAPDWPELLQST